MKNIIIIKIDIKIPMLPVKSPDTEMFGFVDFLDIIPKITAIIPHGIDINQKHAKTIDIILKIEIIIGV